MKKHNVLILLVWFSLPACQFSYAAEDFAIPRTEWGLPDLQGVWNFSSNVPMQRPEEFGEREFLTDEEIAASQLPRLYLGGDAPIKSASGVEAFYNDNIWAENAGRGGDVRTSLIVYPRNGRTPPPENGVNIQSGGEVELAGQRPVRFAIGGIGRDGPEDRGLSERCLVGFNAGPQLTPSVYNNNVQIIQNRDHVVILSEMVHDARIVKLNASSPALDERVVLWSGDSRGHWEGDTLVVITQNFNGLTQSFDGFGTSSHKVLTERITHVGAQTLNYEFTIDDPATFTDKLTAIVPLTKVPTQLYEYACHEGNYGMENMLRAARRKEANEVSDRVANIFRQ